MRYIIEGTRYSRTLLHSFVILGGDEDWLSFQRKKLDTDNCVKDRVMLPQKFNFKTVQYIYWYQGTKHLTYSNLRMKRTAAFYLEEFC